MMATACSPQASLSSRRRLKPSVCLPEMPRKSGLMAQGRFRVVYTYEPMGSAIQRVEPRTLVLPE